MSFVNSWKRRVFVLAACLSLAGFAAAITAQGASPVKETNFSMVRSTASVTANCLADAHVTVNIRNLSAVEVMRVKATGLPPLAHFDLFVIQVPNGPFGMSWYQGDLNARTDGTADGIFIGRFSVETFVVAPGSQPAPVVHHSPIADASSNPATAPVHTYHLGLWFNSPAEAVKAGCAGATTPFNGEHNAGVQAFSTRNYADDQGPLRSFDP